MAKFIFFAVFLLTVSVFAQENADTNIAKSLRECYNNTDYIDSNLKRPMSMNYLIDLIRKVENGPDRMDIQKLSTSLLHRFRQDGILRAPNVRETSIIPFSPYGDENQKFKILLRNIVPTSYLFPNETLNPMERCAMHLMLSESVETILRQDEATTCMKTGKYRQRTRRHADLPPDVEIVEPSKKQKNKGKIQVNPNVEMNVPRKHTPEQPKQESNCPLEYGVVYTKWGAVTAGSVIAGIAAGSEPQNIDIRRNFETEMDKSLNNIWGATLAGNIAELAYLSKGNSKNIEIGADGGFYSSFAPHGYYLSATDNFYFTDAEIRGDLDGLILGTRMAQYRNSARNMKLSQLLDMYYSERGLFNENIKACRRNELLTEFAKTDDIKDQGLAFALVLNKKVTLQTTMDETAIQDAINEATSSFSTYVPSHIRDLSCMNNNENIRVRTDLMVFFDFSLQFDVTESFLSYLADSIDLNPYNSNITLINAQTGDLIVPSTNSLAEFHNNFNRTVYETIQGKGFDLSVSVSAMEKLSSEKMEIERNSMEPSSRSLTALFVANNPSIGGSQKEFILNKLNDTIKPKYPDLRLLAATTGSRDAFSNIVRDVFQIQSNNPYDMSSVTEIVNRLKQIPSRIVSYKCSANWTEVGDDKPISQNVEPQFINYYRVAPNYFYKGDNTRTVKIKGQGQGVLILCYSRDVELPRSTGNNNTETSGSNQQVVCKQITSEEASIELKDPCYDSYTISECAPLYFSVEAKPTTTGIVESCTDKTCRSTDSLKFTITTENFGCFSNANVLFTNLFVLISLFCIVFLRNINN